MYKHIESLRYVRCWFSCEKAVEKGLKVPEYVKTSLAPGSKVVTGYLRDSGLQKYLDDLGFNLVGYGCTTCIGNSGPLLPEIEKAIAKEDLLVTSVLSGNRNFEGRIHPLVKANYLASPQLVVAYALAGTVDIDLQNEPLGKGKDGQDVYLNDIWPSIKEVADTVDSVVTPELFKEEYKMYTTIMKCGMRLMLLTLHYMTSILIQHIFKIQHSSKVYQNQVPLNIKRFTCNG